MIHLIRIILIIVLIRILLNFLYKNYFYQKTKKKQNPIDGFNENVQDADFEEID